MLYWIIFLTLLFEASTIIGRIIWGSKQEKFRKNTSKYKVRIHHGYTGVFLIMIPGVISMISPIFGPYLDSIFILGWAFFLSDAIHHFVVLPLWVGRTEFP